VADVVAVLDATGTRGTRPVVLAGSDTGMVALALAAAHPGRLAGVVLVHGYARYVRAPDYPYGVDAETAAASSSDALEPEPAPGAFDPLAHIAPSLARDAGFRRWWEATGRRAASPATAAALHDAIYRFDVRPLLPAVGVPALVVHRRSCASCDVGHARYLVDHLPRARLALLPGADELWFAGPREPFLAELTAFLDAVG
jgi:pimeloyl-ACP methyl ester carboxylesterase